MSGVVDLYLVYQFIRRLATPFNQWDAFKLGIIDERGNILKSRKQLFRREERAAFGVYDLMLLNIKKLLEKLPGGQTRLASYAAALFLIREWNHFSSDSLLTESVSDSDIIQSLDSFLYGITNYIKLEEHVNRKVSQLDELFDKPYPYNLQVSGNAARTKIKLDDGEMLHIYLTREHDNSWDVIFDRNSTTDVTGSGDQYRIFATVLAVLKDFVKQKSPDTVSFNAYKKGEKLSRINLYDRMIRKFANSLGYSSETDEKTRSGIKFYTLRKMVKEDGPVNNISSGNIAGLGVGPDGEPGVSKTHQKKYRSKNSSKARELIMRRRMK